MVGLGTRRSTSRPCAPNVGSHYMSQNFHVLDGMCLFVISGVFAYRLFAREWWLYQPHEWLQGRDQQGHAVQAAVKFYYLLYTARFVSDFISLFFEIGRNTTTLLVSCLHHAVTLGLIAVAIRGNYIRAAAVIMFFFDWADPPLLLAKACKYLSECNNIDECDATTNDMFQTAANRLFEVFAVTFFLSRNVLYNYVTFQFIVHLPRDAVWEIGCLLSLVALQTYWLLLIIQAAMRQAANAGRVEDVREVNGVVVVNGNGNCQSSKKKQ